MAKNTQDPSEPAKPPPSRPPIVPPSPEIEEELEEGLRQLSGQRPALHHLHSGIPDARASQSERAASRPISPHAELAIHDRLGSVSAPVRSRIRHVLACQVAVNVCFIEAI